jgi:oxygen-independent coproporphyrinogen-3 oxidase
MTGLGAEIEIELAALDVAALARAGIRRDPARYDHLAYFVPAEVAVEHAPDERMRARLAEPTGPVGLYVHVPACTGRCTYCSYAIEVNPRPERLTAYLRALEREIAVRWQGGGIGPVRSVLIGGGTPTYLEVDELDRLLGAIHQAVPIPRDVEFTVESAPETLTPARLDCLRAHGVNRLNIGIQSFDDGILRALARRHDGAGATAAVEMARRAGFTNLNLDLIYAMPGQDLGAWLDSLDRAIDLLPQSITTYHLRRGAGTRIARRVSPPEDQNLVMHLAAIRRLGAAGYRQSLADYFCLAGEATGQVQARDKWRDMQPVDGCGMAAVSRRPDLTALNVATTDEYVRAAATRGWSLRGGRFLDRGEQMCQRAMFALKVLDADGGLDRTRFAAEFGEPVDAVFGEVLGRLTDLRLLADDGARIRMTERGTLFSDEVCACFYPADLRRRLAARPSV